MAEYMAMPGTTLPRRLSTLYNDTKKVSDFVKEPVQSAEADPEVKALHRKLRIQKDRFVSWGLEWSDPGQNQSAEVLIDSSLSKAGLTEVVGSILSTIKDILAEAEPLWQSSRRLAGEGVEEAASAPRKGEKIQMVVWDKKKFEDLVGDLTTSVDTLYDLSRTRSSYAQTSAEARGRLPKFTVSAEDSRSSMLSSRMETARQIDPASLVNLRSMQAEPMTDLVPEERTREIVFMSRQAYTELTGTPSSGRAPLLLEYAPFDPIYSTTGIMPPMTRFEKLSAGLHTEPQRSPGSWTGMPRLLGYFEDVEHSRLGLVYQFPPGFNPVTFEDLTQNPLYSLCSLADLLVRPDFEPKLEAKFRLAANLANTVFDMHARGITHGNLVDANVSFCNAVGTDPEVSGMTTGEVDVRRPLVSSFDLFSDPTMQTESSATSSLHLHPLDPRRTTESPLASNADSKTFDLYSLAMALLCIGLWTKLEDLIPNPESPTIPESVLDRLAVRCGTLYMKAVQTCWNSVHQEMSGVLTSDQIVARVQLRASRYLEACCILDGVNKLEDRLGDDDFFSQEVMAQPGPSKDGGSMEAEATAPAAETSVEGPAEEATRSSEKTRLYPQVPLPPDTVEHWNSVLMPQVNAALSHFYRKNPESVEISLESVGKSPQETRPTVLVVCTSVGKVKSILKKKLGSLFDGTTEYALKVCRGQVFRSRNQRYSRSTDCGEEAVAANPGFQERPQNGASIGAWIGDRHLPPVSFGGLIMVDDKPYGMTVHHMLDDPEQNDGTARARDEVSRSMAGRAPGLPDLQAWYQAQYARSESEEADSSSSEPDFACEFSDSGSDMSESAVTSDASDENEANEEPDYTGPQYDEPGDIPGIEPGCGDGYMVTQPALEDVEAGFYPSPETADEDHLSTYSLGDMYASSGIRRRPDTNGLVHEIDWALFEFRDHREPRGNAIPQVAADATKVAGKRPSTLSPTPPPALAPTQVAPATALPGLEVQCMARTSGLQMGLILPTLTSVKLYGRKSPSHTYQVSGTSSPSTTDEGRETVQHERRKRTLPMGVPGDSGAWVVESVRGRLCGHILAWSERKRVAYICPMEVLLLDIAEALEANDVRLPGGDALDIPGLRDLAKARGKRRPCSGVSDMTEDDGPAYSRSSYRRSDVTTCMSMELATVDEDDDSYDEAVEAELAEDIRRMKLAGRGYHDWE